MSNRSKLFTAGVASLALLPFTAFAATTNFFGPIIPTSGSCLCDNSAMDWGCVLQVAQNVLNALVSFGVLIEILFIAWAGFAIIASGANPAARQRAVNRMLNVVVGLVVILGAWIIVDTVMKYLYEPGTTFSGGVFGPWNELLHGDANSYCLRVNQNPGQLTTGVPTQTLTAIPGDILNPGTGSSAAGSCTAPTGGACSVSNLTSAFGDHASQAAQICSAESANNPQALSGSDRTADGHSYSVGLFQINITNSFNQTVDGRNCSAAFSGPCSGTAVVQSGSLAGHCSSTVVNQQLYNDCVAAAQKPTNNLAAAQAVYGRSNNWNPWGSSGKCGLRS